MFAFYAAEAKKTSKLFAFAIKNNKELELRFKEKNRTKKICKKTDIKYWNMRQDFNDKWKNDTESLQKANEYVFKAYLADKSAIKKTGTALNRACTLAESVAKSLVDFVVDNVGKSIPTHDFIFWLGERHNRQGSGIKIWTVYKKMANDVIERLTAMKSSMNTGK